MGNPPRLPAEAEAYMPGLLNPIREAVKELLDCLEKYNTARAAFRRVGESIPTAPSLESLRHLDREARRYSQDLAASSAQIKALSTAFAEAATDAVEGIYQNPLIPYAVSDAYTTDLMEYVGKVYDFFYAEMGINPAAAAAEVLTDTQAPAES